MSEGSGGKKPKRKSLDGEEHGANHERWMLTYLDMITLLLVLFIVMYTMSTIDVAKFKAMSDALGTVLNGGSEFNNEGVTNPSPSTSESAIADPNAEKLPEETFDEVYKKIKEQIEKNGLAGDVEIENGKDFIAIRLTENLLFYPNKADLRTEAMPIITAMAKTLSQANKYIDHIKIDGHTADIGLESTTSFFSWELSTQRALVVLEYLVKEKSLDQQIMSLEAFAHYQPIADNSTEAGKIKNRRVEFYITKKVIAVAPVAPEKASATEE
jgi:chemotaxis protein MotB